MKTFFKIALFMVIAGLSMAFAPNESIDLLQGIMNYVLAMFKNIGNYIADLINGIAPLVK